VILGVLNLWLLTGVCAWVVRVVLAADAFRDPERPRLVHVDPQGALAGLAVNIVFGPLALASAVQAWRKS
jgi:hypothetical protein